MERGYWIRSKPLYDSLAWQEHATEHCVIAIGDGGIAILKLFQQMYPREPIKILFADDENAKKKLADTISIVVTEGLQLCDSADTVLSELRSYLTGCKMGTQFYVAGTEAQIWAVLKELRPYGVEDVNVKKELTGTLARSVYCVHCKTITENAHHNIETCSGCGRSLLVRDHFSRRLGAYMGFMIDAEQPGQIPTIEEVYP
jgi:predicted RNA-binding Zn-ribbon protein involved in translation (DUF1610 family)